LYPTYQPTNQPVDKHQDSSHSRASLSIACGKIPLLHKSLGLPMADFLVQ
jgi:hypothetical protein